MAATSALDRRRRKLQDARGVTDAATATVTQLEKRIATNAAKGRRAESDLRAAVDRVAALKKTIKASTKEADDLRGAQKAARKRVAKAQERAAKVEGRYDEALRAELFRREKAKDLAGPAASGPRPSDGGVRPGSPSGQDRPDDETPGDDTARATAARRTAARAKATSGPRRPKARNTVGLQPAAQDS